jgi:hypothetical protein
MTSYSRRIVCTPSIANVGTQNSTLCVDSAGCFQRLKGGGTLLNAETIQRRIHMGTGIQPQLLSLNTRTHACIDQLTEQPSPAYLSDMMTLETESHMEP